MASTINQNDPRARRTHRFIQQAFIELLKHKDFDSITIQDISDRAEINRSTFYSHFQDKYELLELTLNTMFLDILSTWITEGNQLDEQALIRNLMLAVCQWQIESRQTINRKSVLSPYIEEHTKKQLYTIIFSCLSSVAQYTSSKARQLEIVAIMLSSSICSIVLHWSNTQKSENPEALVELALPYIMSILHMINES